MRNVGIDTNVFNTVEDPKSDFTATLGSDVSVFVPIWLAEVSVQSETEFVYFHAFESQRSVNSELRVRAEIPFRRVTLFAANSYLTTRERLSFEVDLRSRRAENDFEVGVEVALARKLSLIVSGRQSALEYRDDAVFQNTRLADVFNRDSRAAVVSLQYRLTPLTIVVLTGEASETRFRRSSERDNDSVTVIPGVEFNPQGIISGSAHVGFRHFAGIGAALPDFTGPQADVNVSYRLPGSTRISFDAQRGLAYSFQTREPYYVSAGYGGSVRRQFIGRSDVIVGVQQFTYRYRDLAGGPQQDLTMGHVETTRNYSITVGSSLNQLGRFDVTLSYWQRLSLERVVRNYHGFRVGANVGYGF